MATKMVAVRRNDAPIPGATHGWPPIRGELDRILDQFMMQDGALTIAPLTDDVPAICTPLVEIGEDENAYTLRAHVAGFTEADVVVSLSCDLLTIKGEKAQDDGGDSAFKRSFVLPATIDLDMICAVYAKNVLTVILPKRGAIWRLQDGIAAN